MPRGRARETGAQSWEKRQLRCVCIVGRRCSGSLFIARKWLINFDEFFKKEFAEKVYLNANEIAATHNRAHSIEKRDIRKHYLFFSCAIFVLDAVPSTQISVKISKIHYLFNLYIF